MRQEPSGDIVRDRGAPYTRRQRPLEVYYGRGWITKRQEVAGDQLYWAWVVGVKGANPEPAEFPPEVRTAFGPRDPSGKQLDEIRRFNRAMRALGERLAWVEKVCCEGVMVAELSKSMSVRTDVLMTLLRHALDTLGDHWENNA